MKNLLKLSCLATTVLCAGCHSIGPNTIKESHPRYNDAMGSVIDRQLLTNIVRLKYRENPMFLEINSIAESREFGLDVGFNPIEFQQRINQTVFKSKTMLRNWQRPTISYRPIRGKEFIKHMMTPIPLNVVLGMSSSGWKLQRVFNTCVERINGLENAVNASGPMPWNKPEYEDFYEMTALLKKLEDERVIKIGRNANMNNVIMQIDQNPSKTLEIAEFKRLLSLDDSKNTFKFENDFLKEDGETLVVKTRSLMGILFYLSHAVEVPENDIKNGIVQTTIDDDGNQFDWSKNASGTLLNVHCSKERPDDAFVSTFYRGHWFFIKDNDLHSKSTFLFVSTLFNLQAGEASSNDVEPMLTIPISR